MKLEKNRAEDFTADFVHFIYLAEDRAELLVLYHIPRENWPEQKEKFHNNKRDYLLLAENNKNILVAELPLDNNRLSGDSLQEYEELLLDEESIRSDLH